jgi:hypothetical protein
MAEKAQGRSGGPYLAAALFCEHIIEDKADGAMTPIRIFDTVNMVIPASAPEDFPSENNRLNVSFSALVCFKTGDAPGPHNVVVVMESPSGKKGDVYAQEIVLPPEPQGGINLRLSSTIAVVKGGLFKAHVYLDSNLVTTMPLQINLQRTTATDTSAAQEPVT